MDQDAIATITTGLGNYTPEALPVAQAREFIARLLPPPRERELVALTTALGRTLASDIAASVLLPSVDQAAVDGYALPGRALPTAGESRLRLLAQAPDELIASEAMSGCIAVLRGAPLPAGFDTVVPAELVRLEREAIVLAAGRVAPGANRRRPGDTLALGGVALAAGCVLRAGDIGILAALDVADVPVWRRPRVAALSIGDGLYPLGEPLPSGGQRDVNRYALLAMLGRHDAEAHDFGTLPRNALALSKALRHAARQVDVVLCVGRLDADGEAVLREAMVELGHVEVWQLALGFGHAMAVGRVGEYTRPALLLWLPDQLDELLVSYHLLVREALVALSGASMPRLPSLNAVVTCALAKQAGRTAYVPAVLQANAERWQVEPIGPQHLVAPGIAHPPNCVIELARDQGPVAAGESVVVLPFTGFV
ncbi:MAG: molybdopterin molybdotransferase MoeA [Paucibacter sp.]|nr:molybdopterin molybdotransferase MoeA [Roseateles sp.]